MTYWRINGSTTTPANHLSVQRSHCSTKAKNSPTPSSTSILTTSLKPNLSLIQLETTNFFRTPDCPKYYAKVKNVHTKFTAQSKHILSNMTKEERKALHNLWIDGSHMVIKEKDCILRNAWSYLIMRKYIVNANVTVRVSEIVLHSCTLNALTNH